MARVEVALEKSSINKKEKGKISKRKVKKWIYKKKEIGVWDQSPFFVGVGAGRRPLPSHRGGITHHRTPVAPPLGPPHTGKGS